MSENSNDQGERGAETPLRHGWTTGACAAAAAKAAALALVEGRFPARVEITLPRGQRPAFDVAWSEQGDGWAAAGIVKDAGDDPDVTHGAEVRARVARGVPGGGITFKAGEGVGTVTRPGLPVAVGEPAINPGPRAMITQAVSDLLPDAVVEVSIPGGEVIAKRTMNGRLGIVGGLSILGTTGVVVPYSCSAWIASIHSGIDVARATGLRHVAACTGSTSEATAVKRHGLPETALIDMGDFVGGTLKYLRKHPIDRLTLAGGFAKLSKLALGHLDVHSKRSRVDHAFLAELLRELGASDELCAEALSANTAIHVLELAQGAGLPLGDRIAQLAQQTALSVLDGAPVSVEVVAIDRAGNIVGVADWSHSPSPR